MSFNRYFVYIHNPSTGAKRVAKVTCDRREYVERLVIRTSAELISKVQAGGFVDRFVAEYFGHKPPNSEQREAFYALALIYMGVNNDAAKSIIRAAPQIKSPSLANAVCRFEDSVKHGEDVCVAFKVFKGVLPDADLEALFAARSVGRLSEALSRLRIRSSQGMGVARKVKKAVWYPMILLLMATVVVSLILAYQMPSVVEQYKGFGVTPKGFALFAFRLGELFNGRRWLAAIPPAVIIFLFTRMTSIFGSPKMQRVFYRLPALRTIIYRIAMSDCIGTYAMLRRANVEIQPALEITSRQTILVNVREFFLKCRDSIGRGDVSFFNAAMKHADLLGPDGYEFIQLLKAGEESGASAEIADRVATSYQQSVDVSLDRLSVVLEPLLLVLCGGAVGFVMLLSMLPTAQLQGSMLPAMTNLNQPAAVSSAAP